MSFWSGLGQAFVGGLNSLAGGVPGALINMGTSLIGSSISNSMNRKNMELTQAWQEKMNAQQQQWQERMWNMNNQYNDPSNQMSRLMNAGINPNNAAASVAGSNASSQMAQQPTIPNGNPLPSYGLDLMNAANSGFALGKDNEVKDKQIEYLESQKENVEADTNLKRNQPNVQAAQIAEMNANARAAMKLADKYVSEAKEADSREQLNQFRLSLSSILSSITYQELLNKRKDYDEAVQRIDESRERVNTMKAQQEELRANARLAIANASLVEKKAVTEGFNAEIAKLDRDIKEQEKVMNQVELDLVKKYDVDPRKVTVAGGMVVAVHKMFDILGTFLGSSKRITYDSNTLSGADGYDSGSYKGSQGDWNPF